MSYPSTKINPVKAAVAAVVGQHNAFRDTFNPATVALFQQIDAADNSPEMQALKVLQPAMDAAAAAHNVTVPLIVAARDIWNAAVPNDPLTPPPPTVDAIANPVGWIGGTSTTSTSGWAVDANNPTKHATVKVLVDGIEVARVLANDPSPDVLNNAGVGDGNNRFHVTFPQPGPGTHQVSVQVVGTNYTLLGCPVAITVQGTAPPPSPGGPESLDESGVGVGGGFLTDRYGDQWSVSVDGKVLKNGATFTNAAGSTGRMVNCDGLRYSRHILWGHSADNSWFQWFYTDPSRSLGDWAFCNPPPYVNRPFASLGITPHPNESPNKTRNTTGVTDYLGRAFTFGPPGSNGNLKLLIDGQLHGAEGVEFTYLNHTVVLKDASGLYWDMEHHILGDTFSPMTNCPDPIAVEEGTVDYGPVDEGYRGTHTEAELQADPQFEFPDTIYEWGINPGLYLPGLVSLTTWPSYGNVGVLSSSGKPWNGPNMFNATRGFATRTEDKWLHQTIRVRANTVKNMHEQGIKLSELGANSNIGGTDFISVRLWLRPPYRCLPNHFQVAIYVYDLENFFRSEFGDVLLSRGFIKAEDFEGLSLYCKVNTFQANGTTPNTDGEYIIRQRGRNILHVTGRLNRGAPDIQISYGSLQTYHGGMGAPCQDFDNPTGNAITIEMGAPTAGPVDPGFMRPTAVPPGPSPRVTPLWMQNRRKYVPMTIAGSSAGFWPGQWQYSGWAADYFNGNALARLLWLGGHALNNDNSIFLINWLLDNPRLVQEMLPSSQAVQGAAYATSPNPDHYSDGLPASGHAYWSQWFLPLLNKAVRFAFTASQPEARSTGAADWFDVVTKVISAAPGIPDFLGLGQANWISVYAQDRISGDVYYHNGGNVGKFSQQASAWQALGGPPPQSEIWSYAPGAFDDQRGIFEGVWHDAIHRQDAVSGAYLAPQAVIPDPVYGLPVYYEYNGAVRDYVNDARVYVCPSKFTSPASAVWIIDANGQAKYLGDITTCGSGPCNRVTAYPVLEGAIIQPDGDAIFLPFSD